MRRSSSSRPDKVCFSISSLPIGMLSLPACSSNSASQNRNFGAQSARISLCSTVVRRQFSGTRIAPRRASANSNTSISGLLYPRYAMRSPLATASLLLTNSMRCHRSRYVQSFPSKWIATLDGNCAAQRSMMREKFNSVVRLAELVERFAADAVEAQLGGPRQHQGAAARIAVQALERQRLEHGLPAAGADRQPADVVGVFHDRELRRVGAQARVLGRIDARVLEHAQEEGGGPSRRRCSGRARFPAPPCTACPASTARAWPPCKARRSSAPRRTARQRSSCR